MYRLHREKAKDYMTSAMRKKYEEQTINLKCIIGMLMIWGDVKILSFLHIALSAIIRWLYFSVLSYIHAFMKVKNFDSGNYQKRD